jgi:hypothetical protein
MSWGYRSCSGCNENLYKSEFSKNQWTKGVGISRCQLCVKELVEIDSNGFGTARKNDLSRCDFNFTRVDSRGSFRLVTFGRYTGGKRTGQIAVAKWFQQKYKNISDQFFSSDMMNVEKCLQLLTSWNAEKYIDKTIRLNIPERMTKPNGVHYIVEPYIEDFKKFNSNTGWTSKESSEWIKIMQALSHYTYHKTSGQFLLCDLQGGLYRNGAIITDPIITSRNRTFGSTDLGPNGISSFFGRHTCNKFCRSNWTKPKDCHLYHKEEEGSSLEYNPVIASKYLPSMSVLNENDDHSDY